MSPLPQSVLVAVDFSEASARAVALGGLVADRCRAATLRLLHAETIEAPPYFTAEQVEGLERQRQALEAQAEQFLARFGRQHTPVPFAAAIDGRAPVEAILHESAAADLVVMGTHGRRGPRRWWLGSVAERVLHDIARPLLVLHAPPSGSSQSDADRSVASAFERALVHAAAPLAGRRTLEYAQQLAACVGGEAIDRRYQLIEPAIAESRATSLVVAMPSPRSSAWLSNYGEPLVRTCRLPILFVPEDVQGASS